MTETVLPPGPPLPPGVQAGLMMKFWPRFVSACHRRYGDVFTLRVASMGTLVYLARPEDIKTVFGGDPAVYHAGEANSMLAGLLGSSSVLVVDDAEHRDRRRLMLAPFRREAVARQTGLIARIAADNIAGWPIGRTFAVAPKMSEITLEVILRTVIGATDEQRRAQLRAVMPKLLSVGVWESLAINTPGLQRLAPWRPFRDRLREADRLLYAEIAERRADPDLATRTDALAMMIRTGDMTDAQLRDQLMTLLVAGHDTTATSLSWALERLTRHPAVLAKAVHAARTGADEHLDAVCKEVLRIRPVVFDIGRILTEPTEVAGYRLPAGVMVAPGIGLVHRDAGQYPDPDRFDPDRMLGAALGPTTWLPFGGGNRRCLGANFALVEMAVVLGEVLRRVDLHTSTARAERPRVKGVILIPHRGARIRARRVDALASATCPAHPADVRTELTSGT
ncbi:cytochrome P450 [Mycobacterium frederiksbergense]|uniref:cytochrome P450 n=1 Tax=Mycolicibacterium frederiksbergense TaxID=117567 RepID=UPI0021F39C32|nr:cytochrome P450 [Mycolicibacterium frederiksbergense]MCV7048476.1 cytochrome P450 [Mycolicibacterium frederiksbergense]